MDHIDWTPIADLPEHLKDGREVLLWDGEHGAMVGQWTRAYPLQTSRRAA